MPPNSSKLCVIIFLYENNAFEPIKRYFEKFLNFCKIGKRKILSFVNFSNFTILFKIPPNNSKQSVITFFHKKISFERIKLYFPKF